ARARQRWFPPPRCANLAGLGRATEATDKAALRCETGGAVRGRSAPDYPPFTPCVRSAAAQGALCGSGAPLHKGRSLKRRPAATNGRFGATSGVSWAGDVEPSDSSSRRMTFCGTLLCTRITIGGGMKEALWLALIAMVILTAGVLRFAFRGQRRLGTPTQRAAHIALHTANLAAPALRTGLNKESAGRSIFHFRALLGTRGVVVADVDGVLAAEGVDAEHCALLAPAMQAALSAGRPQVVTAKDLFCSDPGFCELQCGVVVPL